MTQTAIPTPRMPALVKAFATPHVMAGLRPTSSGSADPHNRFATSRSPADAIGRLMQALADSQETSL